MLIGWPKVPPHAALIFHCTPDASPHLPTHSPSTDLSFTTGWQTTHDICHAILMRHRNCANAAADVKPSAAARAIGAAGVETRTTSLLRTYARCSHLGAVFRLCTSALFARRTIAPAYLRESRVKSCRESAADPSRDRGSKVDDAVAADSEHWLGPTAPASIRKEAQFTRFKLHVGRARKPPQPSETAQLQLGVPGPEPPDISLPSRHRQHAPVHRCPRCHPQESHHG